MAVGRTKVSAAEGAEKSAWMRSFGTVLGEALGRGRLRPISPQEAPEKIAQLVARCVHPEPSRRPMMQEVYSILMDVHDNTSNSRNKLDWSLSAASLFSA